VVGTVDVAQAGTGRVTHVESHADLPKHAFGSCAICTRRLLAARQEGPTARGSRTAPVLPTRLLVQTSPVRRRVSDDGRA
jgi:hypothetical protein